MKKIITQPGKFEGEPTWVPAAWDVVMNGFADEVGDEDRPIARISVDSLPETYEELREAVFVELWEDNNGFVHSDVFCEHQTDNWSTRCPEHGHSMQGPDA